MYRSHSQGVDADRVGDLSGGFPQEEESDRQSGGDEF
jgi:hypothetical protein